MSDRAIGLAIAVVSTLTVSFDATWLRYSLQTLGQPRPVVIFWKYASASAVGLMVAVSLARGPRRLCQSVRDGWRHVGLGVMVIFCYCVTNVYSVLWADTAIVLALMSLSPIWVCIYSACVLGDQIQPHTWGAMFFILIAMGLLFTPDILQRDFVEEVSFNDGIFYEVGLLFGFASGIFLGGIVLVGNAAKRANVPAYAIAVCNPLAAGLFALCSAIQCAVTGLALIPEHQSFTVVAVGALNGLISNFWQTSVTIAAMFISPLEVALVLELEPALGPVWVWVYGLGPEPSFFTWLGLLMLLVTLGLHEIFSVMFRQGKASPEGSVLLPISSSEKPAAYGT